MAVAFVALLAALSGTAVALPGKNSVKKDDIARGAVNSSDIRNNAATSSDIRNNTIRGNDVRNNSLTGSDVTRIRGGDVSNDSLTGSDVNEASLGKVPSAGTADSAGAVSTARTIDVKTVNEGSSTTLATYGPFTFTGACVAAAANTRADLNVKTTENNSNVQGLSTSDADFDAADPALAIDTTTDAPGAPPSGGSYDSTLNALAPSGRALTGHIALFVDASAGASGQCKFHGTLDISG